MRGRLVVVRKPELTSVGCSGIRRGQVTVFRGRELELDLACVKREGGSSDVLNTCNVMESFQSLSVPWMVGGSRRRVHCLWKVILYGERRMWRTGKRIPSRHISFSWEPCVGTEMTWYCCFLLLRWIPLRNVQTMHTSDTLQRLWKHRELKADSMCAQTDTEGWIMGWMIELVERMLNYSPTIHNPLLILFISSLQGPYFLFPEGCCAFGFFDDHLFHCN